MTAYLDESYNDEKFFVAAAVAAPRQWQAIEGALGDLRVQVSTTFGLPSDVEFHAVDMFGGRKDWSPLRGRHREIAGITAAMLSEARDARVRYVVRGVNIMALNRRYSIPRHPHSICLEHVLQRLEKYAAYHSQPLRSLELVADDVDIRDDLQSQFAGYQEHGTSSWYHDGKLSHLKTPIQFKDSRQVAGLQVADVVAYLYRRREVITEKHPEARRSMQRLMGIVDQCMINGSGTWHP